MAATVITAALAAGAALGADSSNILSGETAKIEPFAEIEPPRMRIDGAAPPLERGLELPRAERSYGMSLKEAWASGGFIMWCILALSISGGGLSLYLFFILRAGQVVPRPLLSELRDTLGEGDLNGARRACERKASPLASVSLAALDYIRGVPEADAPLLQDTLESEGGRQADDMQSQAQFLLDISVIAPMLGLLGTVLGMLHAFGAIAQDFTAAKPVILAQGVSKAIVTTIFGLIVAIPSMILYAYFRRRAMRMAALLEAASSELLALLSRRPAK